MRNSKLTETDQPGTLVIAFAAKIIGTFMCSGNNNFCHGKCHGKVMEFCSGKTV